MSNNRGKTEDMCESTSENPLPAPSDQEENQCSTALAKKNLKFDTLIPRPEMPYFCNPCNKAFSTEGELRKHLLFHIDAERYQCKICQKSFSRAIHLKEHLLVHSNLKPFRCDICQKDFVRRRNLVDHRFRHNAVKPHKCDKCTKSFHFSQDLKAHSYVHETVKRFKCNVCNDLFISPRALNSHLRKFHEKPHECEKCKNAFHNKVDLQLHQLSHLINDNT